MPIPFQCFLNSQIQLSIAIRYGVNDFLKCPFFRDVLT